MDSFYHEFLTNLYRRFNKERLSEIDGLLQKHKGSEKELICSIFSKYSGNPIEFEFFRNYLEKQFPDLLQSIYEKLNPDKVGQVPSLVEKYNDNKEELIKQLCSKYGIEPYSLVEFLDFNVLSHPETNKPSKDKTSESDFPQSKPVPENTPTQTGFQNKYIYVIAGVLLFLGLSGFLGYKFFNEKRIERIKEMREKAIADSIRISDSLAKVQAEQQRIADSILLVEKERQAFEAACAGEEEPGREFDTETDLSDGTTSESTNNWIVILGSYRTQSEAITVQIEFLKTYKIQTEILNTNNFQNLTKNLYLVVSGRDLTKEEATQTLKNIKDKGIECYIKEGKQ